MLVLVCDQPTLVMQIWQQYNILSSKTQGTRFYLDIINGLMQED